MPIIVQKYGGSSVANEDKIRLIAQRVCQRKAEGYDIVVVVSAMGDTTDHLLSLAQKVSKDPHERELDMLLTAGERISIALLSMAIWDQGYEAISFTGSQSGIITNDSHNKARVVEVRPFRIQDELDRGRIVIVAGYQGVSYRREITSLGRGGTDTTAVAMAAALGAEACEIYSDVDGVYSADPRTVLDAQRLTEISSDEMLTLSRHGAKVLNADAVAYAQKRGIALFAKASFGPEGDQGTIVRVDPPEDPLRISGVTKRSDAFLCTFDLNGPEGVSASQTLVALVDSGLAPDHVLSADDRLSLILYEENHPGLTLQLREFQQKHGSEIRVLEKIHTASMVGHALSGDPALCKGATEIVKEIWSPQGLLVEPLALTFLFQRSENPEEEAKLKKIVSSLHKRFVLGTNPD